MAHLKWARPRWAEALRQRTGGEVDMLRRPVEDFARATLTLEDAKRERKALRASLADVRSRLARKDGGR